VSIERPHDADARHHGWAVEINDEHQREHRCLPLRRQVLSLRELGDVVACVPQSDELATAGHANGIVEGAGPGHQFERGTRIAPLPANVRASCNARFLVDAPGTARRLELLSKGNCRTIAPSSDWTSKDAARSMIFMGA